MTSRNESLDPSSDGGHAPTTGRRHLLGAGLGVAGGAVAAVGLAGAPAQAAADNASFWSHGPVRVADTRSGRRITKGQIAGGTSRTVELSDFFLNNNAISVILNLTVINTTGRGSLVVWENGAVRPDVFSLNWAGSGQAVSNLALTGLRFSDLTFKLYCGGANAAAHVVVDMFGYFYREGTARARSPVERHEQPLG